MPRPFQSLTIDQFATLLEIFPIERKISSVDVHHTWRPNHAQFAARAPGEIIEAMWRVHTQQYGWSDIAQHITIDPRGVIWTGRDWNQPPVSATGHNGNGHAGPFMIELIGDFDLGGDAFVDPQRQAAISAVTLIQKRFGLPPDSLRFHRQLSDKPCPGPQIDYDAFLKELRMQREHPAAGANRSLFGEEPVFGAEFRKTREIVRMIVESYTSPQRGINADQGELEENRMTRQTASLLGGNRAVAGGGPAGQARDTQTFTPDQLASLRPYVVDLRMGAFDATGQFSTSQQDVDEIFGEHIPAELAARMAKGQKLELMFYAHGGLVDEAGGLDEALTHLDFWRKNGIYPIFFVWETGLGETVQDIVTGLFSGGARDTSSIKDQILVALARPGGQAVWSQMKRSAQLASLPTGGALYVAQKTADLWKNHSADMHIHAAGHSAGAIFHSYFLPTLVSQPVAGDVPPINLQTMHFLAPAVTADLFIKNLLPLVGNNKPIPRMTMYTMHEELEKADTAGPYDGSLLYLVSNAFEDVQPTLLLGLEESIRQSPPLIRFFGLAGFQGPQADLIFSQTPIGASPRSATRATSHGGNNGFANDPDTLGSVVRRALNIPDTEPIFEFALPPDQGRDIFAQRPVSAAPPSTPAPLLAAAPGAFPPAIVQPGATGTRRALCIGIDQYPDPNALSGCVNDAHNWASTLAALGFQPTILTDRQADRNGILGAIRDILQKSRAGDVTVIQYSGHGTRLPEQAIVGGGDAICPIDFAGGGFILHTDLRTLFDAAADGVNVTCFMDCCHSGTNTRLIAGISPANVEGLGRLKARFIPATPEMMGAFLAFRQKLAPRALIAARGPAEMKQVAFAACQDNEVAFEDNGAGVFTAHATELLQSRLASVTNSQFEKMVVAAFGAPAQQRPNLDCAPDSETLPFLQPLNSASLPPSAPAATVPPQNLVSRVADLERRLAAAGL